MRFPNKGFIALNRAENSKQEAEWDQSGTYPS